MSAAGRAGFRLLRLEATPGWAGAGVSGATFEPGSGAGSWSARAEVLVPPAGSPIFAGHFPGHPVLPGIAHLALVQEVLEKLSAADRAGGPRPQAEIVEVHALRLRRAIGPGDRLALRLEARGGEGAGAAIRFELRRLPAAGPAAAAPHAGPAESGGAASPAGEVASQGIVGTAVTGQGPLPGRPGGIYAPAPPVPGTATEFPGVAELLPHAPPARLLSAVLAADEGGIACEAVLPDSHPLAAAGAVPGFLAIELAAQAAAALETLLRQQHGATKAAARIGYLVGVRDSYFHPSLPTDRPLTVTATPTGAAAALTTYKTEIKGQEASGAERLAIGSLSTFLPDT